MGRKSRLKAQRRIDGSLKIRKKDIIKAKGERTLLDTLVDIGMKNLNASYPNGEPNPYFGLSLLADYPLIRRNVSAHEIDFSNDVIEWYRTEDRDRNVYPPFLVHFTKLGVVRPPFEKAFLELTDLDVSDDAGAGFGDYGCAATCFQEEDVEDGITYYEVWNFCIYDDTGYAIGGVDIRLTSEGQVVDLNSMFWKVGQGYCRDYIRFYHILYSVLRSLSLVNMRNIELIDNIPNPRLSEIHQREYGRPLLTYKTLSIKTTRKEYQNGREGESAEDVSSRRLHVVRGHPRHVAGHPFIPDGTYWIPAHIRGDEQLGTIIKDYKVRAN